MNFRQLEYFVAAAEAGTMTRAAKRCHVAQPSLSQQIQKLERSLGTSLFDRFGSGVTLTEAGKVLLPRARQILAQLREMEAGLSQDLEEGAGTFAIGVIPTVAPYLLPRALPRLREVFPQAEITVQEGLTDVVSEGVVDHRLDLAVTSTPIRHELLETQVVGREPFVAVVPSSHPLGPIDSVSLEELKEEPMVVLSAVHCLGEQIQGFCTRRGLARRIVCEGTQLSTVLELVGAGMGFSVVPAMAAEQDHSDARLYLPLGQEGGEREIALVRRLGKSPSRIETHFSGLVREILAERECGE